MCDLKRGDKIARIIIALFEISFKLSAIIVNIASCYVCTGITQWAISKLAQCSLVYVACFVFCLL